VILSKERILLNNHIHSIDQRIAFKGTVPGEQKSYGTRAIVTENSTAFPVHYPWEKSKKKEKKKNLLFTFKKLVKKKNFFVFLFIFYYMSLGYTTVKNGLQFF
jgi:hypothetical protein